MEENGTCIFISAQLLTGRRNKWRFEIELATRQEVPTQRLWIRGQLQQDYFQCFSPMNCSAIYLVGLNHVSLFLVLYLLVICLFTVFFPHPIPWTVFLPRRTITFVPVIIFTFQCLILSYLVESFKRIIH